MNMFSQAQLWKKYLSKEYLSLNIIKQWNILVHDVMNLFHIYVYIDKAETDK